MGPPGEHVPHPFEFRRESDGRVYRFEPVPGGSGERWKRVDADLWCEEDAAGWWIVDGGGNRLGWPVNDGSHAWPPEGRWHSEKDGRSYVYRLVYTGE